MSDLSGIANWVLPKTDDLLSDGRRSAAAIWLSQIHLQRSDASSLSGFTLRHRHQQSVYENTVNRHGNYVLAAVATGVIASVVAASVAAH